MCAFERFLQINLMLFYDFTILILHFFLRNDILLLLQQCCHEILFEPITIPIYSFRIQNYYVLYLFDEEEKERCTLHIHFVNCLSVSIALVSLFSFFIELQTTTRYSFIQSAKRYNHIDIQTYQNFFIRSLK